MKPPFEVYFSTEVADQEGHVCTAENPEIAKEIARLLNIASRKGRRVTGQPVAGDQIAARREAGERTKVETLRARPTR